jgi:hypothetical protein
MKAFYFIDRDLSARALTIVAYASGTAFFVYGWYDDFLCDRMRIFQPRCLGNRVGKCAAAAAIGRSGFILGYKEGLFLRKLHAHHSNKHHSIRNRL